MLITQFDIITAVFPTAEAVIPEEVAQADIVTIPGKIPGGIYHSEHMRWINDLTQVESADKAIRSKKERKAIQENRVWLEQQGFTFGIRPMIEEDFFSFKELYEQTTMKQQRAIHYSMEASIRGKILAGLPVFCAGMYKENVLESGLVFAVNSATTTAVVSFGAKKKFPELRGGVGGILEYELLKFCFEKQLQRIDHGRSPNPSGFLNKSGLFEFKARYGNTAYPEGKWVTSFVKNPQFAMKELIYVSVVDDEIGYRVVSDNEQEDVEKRYKTRGVRNIKLLPLEECTSQFYQQFSRAES